MTVAAPGKLIVLALVAVGCLIVIIVGMVTGNDTTAAWGALMAIIGYLVGNGAGARRGQEQIPVFAPPETPAH